MPHEFLKLSILCSLMVFPAAGVLALDAGDLPSEPEPMSNSDGATAANTEILGDAPARAVGNSFEASGGTLDPDTTVTPDGADLATMQADETQGLADIYAEDAPKLPQE